VPPHGVRTRNVAAVALMLSVLSFVAQGFADFACEGQLVSHLIWFGATLALALTALVLGLVDLSRSGLGRAAVIPAIAILHLAVSGVGGFFAFIGAGFACI
jgi:hypothetical protein